MPPKKAPLRVEYTEQAVAEGQDLVSIELVITKYDLEMLNRMFPEWLQGLHKTAKVELLSLIIVAHKRTEATEAPNFDDEDDKEPEGTPE